MTQGVRQASEDAEAKLDLDAVRLAPRHTSERLTDIASASGKLECKATRVA